MSDTLEQVTVNWKCGKCDVMHTEEFTISDQVADRIAVIELVSHIVLTTDDEPHLSVYCVRDGVTSDETAAVLLTTLLRQVL